jgi:hypothetical protein
MDRGTIVHVIGFKENVIQIVETNVESVKIRSLFNQMSIPTLTFLSLQSTYYIRLDFLLLHSMIDFLFYPFNFAYVI